MNIINIRNKIVKHYKEKDETYREAQQKHNRKWLKYYGDKRWKKLREWKITKDPICENCAHYGIATPACHVHHIIPFASAVSEEEKFKLLLSPLNLKSVCKDCHELYHECLRQGDNVEWPKPKWMTANEI